MSSAPILQVRRNEKLEWVVAAKWPNGRDEEVANFENESDAAEWVAYEIRNWAQAKPDNASIRKQKAGRAHQKRPQARLRARTTAD